ncbi:GTA-gp10 family protein [Phaeobacter gallaeciensis]|uniref:GTA-gp10 family protein n=1 Tax=Phaeobacter gallaeciensis TaxID=60890 RepID=UPI00237F3E01|nr:GTA-gp10 family protein [Phaeobacter gallaeciensis]MDE4059772.1 GTA-gp10 family protein [Phaeobacter gallaeciensis]MDE4122591.1 GTA-gp10 family protein [Phaeobacter gallaeciensis]MDE4127260.1 GTA-gp10 family protein [Phaeobacter gallaeciensis]
MGIAITAKRGGLVEELAGAPRSLILRNGEIERFEDIHGGIFALWDGFYGRGMKPTARQVRDLVALGLVGGGMDDADADRLVGALGPDENLHLYKIANGLIGVAFMPDTAEGGGDEVDPDADSPDEKKTDPALGE